jgi:hypothetical protein
MKKIITRNEFLDMSMPKYEGKGEVISPRMILLPNNIGLINENKYKIRLDTTNDTVELTKLEH